jgi:hypothetical protein
MNKMLIVIGIIIAILGIGFALDEGFIQNPLGGVTPTTIQKDMPFPTEISTALANLKTETKEVCETYPPIECLKLENPKEPLDPEKNPCIEWEDYKTKGCTEFDSKIGECLKWDYEPKCNPTETPIGITNVTINPTRKTIDSDCYSFKDTNGLLNIEEQCLDKGTNPETYLQKRLTALANEKINEETKGKNLEPLPEPIEVTIK